jgi:hypothetical protein
MYAISEQSVRRFRESRQNKDVPRFNGSGVRLVEWSRNHETPNC